MQPSTQASNAWRVLFLLFLANLFNFFDRTIPAIIAEPIRVHRLIAGEAAMDNARDATQVFGGYGFMNEYLVARHYRDSKILEIGEGTTEVQLMLIARELGL